MTRIELPRTEFGRHAAAEARTVWAGATIVASILLGTGVVLGVTGVLPIAALALLGAGAAGVAAVREQPRRWFGWFLASLSSIALVTITIASLIARP